MLYEDEPYQVAPAERWREILPLIATNDALDEKWSKRFPLSLDEALGERVPRLGRYVKGLNWSLGHTITMRDIGLQVLKRDTPDLALVYFEGADSLGHRFWLFRQPREEVVRALTATGYDPELADELIAKYALVIDTYYAFLDEAIGALLAEYGSEGWVVVASDHGFTDRPKTAALFAETPIPFNGSLQLEGTLIVHGPGVPAGATIDGATLYDLAPTLMDMLGISVNADFDGSSLFPEFRSADPTVVNVAANFVLNLCKLTRIVLWRHTVPRPSGPASTVAAR